MSFEIIDNTFQVIVLAAMALLAFLLAFRRSSRSCLWALCTTCSI